MSTYRQTRLRAGSDVIGRIAEGLGQALRTVIRGQKTRQRELAERQRREREARERRERTAERDRRRTMNKVRRRQKDAGSAGETIAAVESLEAQLNKRFVRLLAWQESERAREHLDAARAARARGDVEGARNAAGKAIGAFDLAERTALRRRREAETERRRAEEAYNNALAGIKAAGETDEILRKWKKSEIDKIEDRLMQAGAALESGEYEIVSTAAAEALAELERLRKEAQEKEQQYRLREEMANRISESLAEIGFDVSIGRDGEAPESHVILSASKPSGESFSAAIGLDATLNYELDGYEGESCLGEVGELERLLAEKHGIEMEGGDHVYKGGELPPAGSARPLPQAREAAAE